MRSGNPFNKVKALPRMSWSPHNLYNLYQRTFGPPSQETKFIRSSLTLYQQKWKSKRLLRAYHGDWIGETKFKRWLLPPNLPTSLEEVSGTSVTGGSEGGKPSTEAATAASKWARRAARGDVTSGLGKGNEDGYEPLPIGSMMFRNLERRLDVVVFRSCFAPSSWDARRLVVHGKVKLNGEKHNDPNTLLNPGDLVQVEPSAIPFLHDESKEGKGKAEEGAEAGATKDADMGATEELAEGSGESEAATASSEKKPTPKKQPSLPPGVLRFNLPEYASPFLFIPPYLEPSFSTCSTVYVRHPTVHPGKNGSSGLSEIPSPYDANGEVMRLGWEWYAQNSPRKKGDERKLRLTAKDGQGFERQRARDELRKYLKMKKRSKK